MASTGAGEAPATSPSLTKVHIVSRSRSGSSSSLELDNTQSFYGIRRTTSQERHSRPTSPPVTPSQTTTSSNPRSPSAHSASILPAASFFNPKRATPLSSTARPLSPGATPASSDHSAAAAAHNWRFSTGPSLGSSGDSQEPQQHITQRRVGNGPLITRISAAVEYATPPSATTSFPPASSSAGRAGGRKYSSGDDMSDEDVEQDLASGGLSAARLARINRSGSQERGFGGSRTSLEQLGGGAGATAGSMGRQSFDVDDPASSVGHGQRDSSDFTFGAPPIVPTPQASRDHLVTSPEPITRLQQYPTGSPRMNDYPEGNGNGNKEGAIARARASISGSPRSSPREDQGAWSSSQGGAPRRTGGGVQLMDVETSGEYEREPQRSDAVPHPSTSAANLPKAQHTRVEIPTRPLVDAQGRKVRNYQLHEGSNRFYLRGRVLSSQDNPTPFVLSLALAVVMPILFFAFSGPFLWSHLGGGGKASIFIFVYMCLIMWSSMCKTAWRDPGIVPRALDLTPERKWVDDLHGEGQGGWRAEPKYMRIGEGVVSSKWCETCETYRPPRTSHCRLCDNCVEHTDHHCTFLNNCIGRRNYTSFVAFLVSAIFCAIYALSFSSWHIARRHALSTNPSSSEFDSAWASRWDVVASFVVAILSFALLCPIAGLMGYHMKLLWVNRTTIENLRPKTDRSGAINPADGQPMGNLYALSSPFSNIVSLLCRPMEIPSYIEPHRYALKDLREEQQAAREKGNADGAV